MHSAFREGFEQTKVAIAKVATAKVAFLWANPKTFKDHLAVLKHYGYDKDPEMYVRAMRDNLKMGRFGAESMVDILPRLKPVGFP